MFKTVASAVDVRQFSGEAPAIAESDVKRVFMVMHGYYGNLFFTKFATGVMVAIAGSRGPGGKELEEDQGIANARRIWSHGLRPFDAEVIKAALRQCQDKHKEFPPSLPQFVALCAANLPPPKVQRPQAAVGMSAELRSKYATEAKLKVQMHILAARDAAIGYVKVPPTLDGLKLAIATAAAEGGADEATELVRLNRMLSARGMHQ